MAAEASERGAEAQSQEDARAVGEQGADGQTGQEGQEGKEGEDTPLPLPYRMDEEGKILPLEGVESIFLTGTTIEIVGLQDISSGEPNSKTAMCVSKEKLLGDIQFRGAISDFHCLKSQIMEADYDPILVRYNHDDIYGDGNNFEIFTIKSAADLVQFIENEKEARRKREEEEAARIAEEKSKPRSKRKWVINPWKSWGSEVEIEEESVRPQRKKIVLAMGRKRHEFNRPLKFSDKDAQELWNSSQMECRPFKDPNFSLQIMELDKGIQAVPHLSDEGTQATGLRSVPGCTQYEPLDMPLEKKVKLLNSKDMTDFLERIRPGYEAALIQNEITNIFEDDFSIVGDEDGVSGSRKENVITEHQSFTSLDYSKNKVVSSIQWLPRRKGVVAVSFTDSYSHQERVERAGRPSTAAILIWNFKDPIHPEYVLESPFETSCFKYNPANPKIVAAGCLNGQIVTWDTTDETERIGRAKNVKREDGGDETSVPVVKHRHLSASEFSHTSRVADLHWLDGIEVTKSGQMNKVADGVLGKECNFFATLAGDGKVMFWDMRTERSAKKGQKGDAWRPLYVVALISSEGGDLSCLKFSFSLESNIKTDFFVASFDGEMVHAEWTRAEGVEHPDHTKSIHLSHAGPVVALARSPFFDDVLLSVGDWTFQIWKEGHEKPLFVSPFAQDYYVAACWSPTRPAVIYLSMEGGVLEVWDLLDRTHEPSITTTVSSTTVASMAFNGTSNRSTNTSQQLLALGDSVGVLHIMELPRNLRRALHNEKNLMVQFIRREISRLAAVEHREPMRQEVLKALEEKSKEKEGEGDKENAGRDNTVSEGPSEKEEQDYILLEQQLRSRLNIGGAVAEAKGGEPLRA